MASFADMLLQKRRKLEQEARALLDNAERENRSLTGEENRQFDEIGTAMEGLKSQSDRIVKMNLEEREMSDAMRGLGHSPVESADSAILEQFRSIAQGNGKGFDLDVTRADSKVLTEHRVLSKGTAGAGGATVSTSLVGQLYEHLIESSTLMSGGATIFVTSGGENIDVPVTTAHSTGALVAESQQIATSEPTFAARRLGAFKYGAMIYVPTELLQDTGVDLTGYLARQAGRAVGNALGTHLISGTGTTQPFGILAHTTLGKTGGAGQTGAPTADELIDLLYSVAPSYRKSPEAAWLVKDSTIAVIRKLKDGQNNYLWQPSAIAGQPDMFLGHPVYSDPNMPATALSAKSVVFGDLSTYWVRIVQGVRFERSDDFKFDTDVVSFRCLIRGDGLLVDQSGSCKHYIGNAA